MHLRYLNFIRGVSANWISRMGVALATSSFIVFIFMEGLRLLGFITNAYIGLITYLIFPTLFAAGLLLIPIGWRAYVKSSGRSAKDLLSDRFSDDEVRGGLFGSKLMHTIGLMTLINAVFLGAVSGRALHFMDQASFCGTACHTVMNPEWTTYRQSPHARVMCVECHVGEGAGALINSKLNGAWQIISLTFKLYEKPIPTPVHSLRPARETCEKCHWPDKFTGNRLRTIIHYELDEASTEKYTTLNMKIGSGEEGLESGSHWHIAEKNQVRYQPIDEKRMRMKWVEVRQPDGGFKRYSNRTLRDRQNANEQPVRVMDCVDCHNRATHIYEQPELAIDDRINKGLLSRELPFIKAEGLAAITKNYRSKDRGMELIAKRMEHFYRYNYPEIFEARSAEIDGAVGTLQAIYHRNVHPTMGITWGSYPDNLGHRRGPGCFRCHNPDFIDEEGNSISGDCTLCHSILAYDEDELFKYLFPIDERETDYQMQKYLQDEFFKEY